MPTSDTLQARLKLEQVRLTILGAPLSLMSAPILATLGTVLLWTRTLSAAWLITWWVAVLIVYGTRIAMRAQFLRKPTANAQGYARLRLRIIASVFFTGVVWGLAPFLPLSGDAFMNTAILAFLIAGVTSSGVTTLAADRVVAIAFITPCLVPLTLLLLLDNSAVANGLGAMVAMHFVVAIHAVGQINKNLAENIRLRLASEAQQADVETSDARLREHAALNGVIAAAQDRFIRDTDLNALFDEMLRAVLPLTHSNYGFIGAVRDVGNQPTVQAYAVADLAWSDTTREQHTQTIAQGVELHDLDTIVGAALILRTTISSNCVAQDNRASGLPLHHAPFTTLLCAPIILGGELLGIFCIANRPNGYDTAIEEYLAPLLTSMMHFIDAKRNDAARRVAEQHVASMHAQLSAFIEHTPAAVAMFDRDMHFLAHSQRWRYDFGIGDEWLIGKSLYEILPDIPALWRESYERALQGQVEGEEGDPYIRSDGTVRWLRWEARPWFKGESDIGGIVLFCEDITESKRAADALNARDQLLVKLSARIPGMLFQLRFQKAENRSSLLYASEGAFGIYGLTTDELADDPDFIFRVCHPDDQLILNAAIANAAREGGVLSIEHRICVANKPIRWLHIEAALERLADASIIWHGYVQDITERKKSQDEVAETAERLRLAARAHALGIWDCVIATNTLTFDRRMYEIYEASASDHPDPWALWNERIHPDDDKRVRKEIAQLAQAAHDGAEIFITEFRLRSPTGALRRVRARCAVDRDTSGRAIRIVGVNWDMGLETELGNTPMKTLAVLSYARDAMAANRDGSEMRRAEHE